MSGNKKLILGRVVEYDNQTGVVPLSNQLTEHDVRVLDHQQRLAALIAAAYLYRDDPSEHHLNLLEEAARAI